MAAPTPANRGYFHTQLSVVRAALAERLHDPNNVYWVAAELNLYIQEALHAFQAFTNWYRERANLQLQVGSLFYDLTAPGVLLPNATSFAPNLFGYNVSSQTLAAQILYHLIEPQLTGNPFTLNGTGQFTLTQIQNAIQYRVNRFLGDSGCVASYLLQNVVPPPNGRVNLPDTTIDVLRAVWVDQPDQFTNNRRKLYRDDEFGLNAFKPGWQNQGYAPYGGTQELPDVYSMALEPPVSIQIGPPPTNPGSIELCLVQSGPPVNLSVPPNPDIIGLPDDFAYAVKWGALADMLSGDGQSRDTQRAMYCESRYQEAVQLARLFPAVLNALSGNKSLHVETLFDLDSFLPSWHNQPPGQTQYIASIGRNLLAVAPQPNQQGNMLVDIARNMPIPIIDTDYLQVSRDIVDVVLDEAQHIALFKKGGAEFFESTALHRNFLYACGEYNARLAKQTFYQTALKQPATQYQMEVPVK